MSKETALCAVHEQLGATMTDFGGWKMPLKYSSELAEHQAVREAIGLFDLSHMGQLLLSGPGTVDLLNYAFSGNFTPMSIGRAKYTLMLNADGGVIDDLIVYRLGEDEFMAVPNAANNDVVLSQLRQRLAQYTADHPDHAPIAIDDIGPNQSILAVQGPKAAALLENVGAPVAELKFYTCTRAVLDGQYQVLLARTGYTGEDGFELYIPNADAEAVWQLLLERGAADGIVPAGLAARDTLRLEAGLHLYGHELATDIDPLTAGLGSAVSFKKECPFIGREALEPRQGQETDSVLVGLRAEGRRAARAGYPVVADGQEIGRVTSGALSPTLGYPIAMAYIRRENAQLGASVEVDIRGKLQPYQVVELPFYRRAKKEGK